jgi:tetratricopeptide (TPR) repeat protein
VILSPALALVAALGAAVTDPAARFANANALAAAGELEEAKRGYEALLAEGLESPALHVNLGSVRLRAGRRGAAIASFERALRLDPRDADARANLELARGRGSPPFAADPDLVTRVLERTPDGWATAAFAFPWAALWLALLLRRRAYGRSRARLSRGAAVAAIAAVLGAALVAGRVAERRKTVAVVISPHSPLRAGPEEALRPALELPEGTSVRVLEERGDSARVRLANGVEGWIPGRDLEAL